MNRSAQALEYYRQKEMDVFPRIPGMAELMKNYTGSAVDMAKQYPDAAFAVMTSREILSGDREQNAICQQAYFDILKGQNIADVRRRYEKAMDRYMRDHSWDD